MWETVMQKWNSTSSSQSKALKGERIEELDVLRGLAALMVVIYHYTVVYSTGADSAVPYGVLAVNLFFMISGFVIFMTLSKSRSVNEFAISRFSRLFPVFWVAVLLTQTVVWLNPLPVYSVSWGDALINLTMLAGPLHFPWVDNVYWSLVIELMFYVIMMGIHLLGMLQHIERFVLPWLLLQLTAAFLSRATHQPIPQIIAVLFLLKYAHLFLAGILFYRIRFDGLTISRQLLIACCLITQFFLKGFCGGGFALVFFMLFYLLALKRLNWIALRPLVFLGTISYSLYLVHQNIGFVIMRALHWAPRYLQVTIAIVFVLMLSSILVFLIEKPSLRVIRGIYKKKSSSSKQ